LKLETLKLETAFLFLLLASPFAAAQRADSGPNVDAYIQRTLAAQKIPGIAILVRRNGHTIFSKGYGYANVEHDVPVTPETIFQSGSTGKQFTAMLVMMLAEDHKLALDDPVAKYLAVPPTWSVIGRPITIRHLLTHTSGLGDYPEDFSMRRDYTEAELFEMVKRQPLASPPGEKWAYSNLGYLTLGILIHQVSGKFYGDLLAERIFTPLGMRSTRIISESDIVPHRAAGYVLKDGALKNQEWVSPSLNTTADGALYYNLEDLALWDAALDRGALISPAGYREMWSPVRLSSGATAPYGFAWALHHTAQGHRVIEHSGHWQGFSTFIARYPDDHLSVIVLCNLGDVKTGDIAHAIADLYQPGSGKVSD
jgi:CubicO group peptidase (beta-lactamase class C family)